MLPRNYGILNGILGGILNKIASSFVSLTPSNDGITAMTGFFDGISGILNEIASVALLPRNDGISAMTNF